MFRGIEGRHEITIEDKAHAENKMSREMGKEFNNLHRIRPRKLVGVLDITQTGEKTN